LKVTGWGFGTMEFYDFPETVGNVIIPTDELTPSFFRGVGIPPTRIFHILGMSSSQLTKPYFSEG